MKNNGAYIFRLTALVMLVIGAGSAGAHVEMKLDPYDEAKNQGLRVTDFDFVQVAVFGLDHVDVRDIKKNTVRLGTRGDTGARARGSRHEDVNADGFPDLLLKFKVEETGLEFSEDKTAVLTGGFTGGRKIFSSYDIFTDPGSTISGCYTVGGSDEAGIRCEYTVSATVNIVELVAAINAAIVSGDTITNNSAVVVESYGGKGHDGHELKGVNKIPGKGGARGYASTIRTLDELLALAENATDLSLYVGEDGPTNQDGGSSSMVIGKPVTTVIHVLSPVSEKVLTIAAGGGGGGKVTEASIFKQRDGYDGGAGAIAVGDLLGNSSVAGADGAIKNKGQGGNKDGLGSGGKRQVVRIKEKPELTGSEDTAVKHLLNRQVPSGMALISTGQVAREELAVKKAPLAVALVVSAAVVEEEAEIVKAAAVAEAVGLDKLPLHPRV